MNQRTFEDFVMFCNSTGNQTVNILPVLQLCCKQAVIISTQYTEESGLTQRLIRILQNRDIKTEKIIISKDEEKNLNELTNKLIHYSKNYPKIVWNISGGQKIPASAMICTFQKRITEGFRDDIVTYTEANPPEIWYFDSTYKNYHERSSVFLNLKEFLYLFGYEKISGDKLYPEPSEEVRQNLKIGKKGLEYFKVSETFREAFFNYMRSPICKSNIRELIKKTLNELKPEFNNLTISKTGYEDLEKKIESIFSSLHKVKSKEDCVRLIKPLKLITKPKEIYDGYWNSIKKTVIENTIKKLEMEEVELISSSAKSVYIDELLSQIKDIGGSVDYISEPLYKRNIPSFSSFKSNGILFEWMVAAAILDELGKNEKIKNSISEIYHSVKTKKLNAEEKPDAEHDIVIVTRFGTLILIEIKTYDFSGDLAQAQGGLAYKKSGPYGTAIIIGPLISSIVKTDPQGRKKFPPYINDIIKTQEETARQNNIEYYYLDKIPDMLKKKLFI